IFRNGLIAEIPLPRNGIGNSLPVLCQSCLEGEFICIRVESDRLSRIQAIGCVFKYETRRVAVNGKRGIPQLIIAGLIACNQSQWPTNLLSSLLVDELNRLTLSVRIPFKPKTL